MKHCQWCDAQFLAKTSYQIYCSVGCRDLATKEKIALRYEQTRRERRRDKDRRCKICDDPLSIYNDEKTCETCVVDPKEVGRVLRQIRGIANGKDKFSDWETKQDPSN